MIPQDVIDRIERECDIEDVVGEVVSLKRSGRNLQGLCPFHHEKTPSFNVNPERQMFKCFGCGKGGGVFKFLELHQGMSFPEAARALAERLGIEIPEADGDAERHRQERARRRSLLDVMERAATFFERQLQTSGGSEHLRYLQRRGFGRDAVEQFRLGYAPGGFGADTHLSEAATSAGCKVADLVAVGLVRRREVDGVETGEPRDFFRDRLMFPIEDDSGRVIAFGGRTLSDRGPKYLNSRETELFQKSTCLYGFHRARTSIARLRRVLLMEGYTDVIAAHVSGFENAVATLGTSLTVDHARRLKKVADGIDLVFDGDDAGMAAAARALDVLVGVGLDARVVILPEGDDPCELLLGKDGSTDREARERGARRFRVLLEEGKEPIAFLVDLAARRFDTNTVDGKARAIRSCLDYAAGASELVRELLVDQISAAYDVGRRGLESELERALETRRRRERRRPPADASPSEAPTALGQGADFLGGAEASSQKPGIGQPGFGHAGAAQQRSQAPTSPEGLTLSEAEGILAACLLRPDLLACVEDRVPLEILETEHPAHGRLLGVAFDLGLALSLQGVRESTEEAEVQGLAERLSRVTIEDPASYLHDCLQAAEKRRLGAELAAAKAAALHADETGDTDSRDAQLRVILELEVELRRLGGPVVPSPIPARPRLTPSAAAPTAAAGARPPEPHRTEPQSSEMEGPASPAATATTDEAVRGGALADEVGTTVMGGEGEDDEERLASLAFLESEVDFFQSEDAVEVFHDYEEEPAGTDPNDDRYPQPERSDHL